MATLHLCPLGAPTVCAEIKAKLKTDSLNGKRGGGAGGGGVLLPGVQAGRRTNKMHSLHAKLGERERGRAGSEAEQEQEKRLLFHFASSLTAFALLIDALLGTYVLCELLYHLRPPSDTPLQTVQSCRKL